MKFVFWLQVKCGLGGSGNHRVESLFLLAIQRSIAKVFSFDVVTIPITIGAQCRIQSRSTHLPDVNVDEALIAAKALGKHVLHLLFFAVDSLNDAG
jgi:hypothetical protein